MLVLTRKSNQSIMIGDDIEVSVLSIMGEKVRIGIQAPRDIPVFRKEVYLEIQQERADARSAGRRRATRSTRPCASSAPRRQWPARAAARRLARAPQPITSTASRTSPTVTRTAVRDEHEHEQRRSAPSRACAALDLALARARCAASRAERSARSRSSCVSLDERPLEAGRGSVAVACAIARRAWLPALSTRSTARARLGAPRRASARERLGVADVGRDRRASCA